ncbi:MAG: FliH/SctL family protein [Pseudomonadota bacterium]
MPDNLHNDPPKTRIPRARVLPANGAGGFRRWPFAALEKETAASAAEPPATPDAPAMASRADESLEALRAAARDEGYAAGRAEGLEAGRAEAATELNQQLEILAALIDSAGQPLEALDNALELQLAELALGLAGALFQAEIETRPEQLTEIIRTAAATLPAASPDLRISVCAADQALLHPYAETQQLSWNIVVDPALERGELRIESGFSEVDGRLESRLREFRAALHAS